MAYKIYVGGLPYSTTDEELQELFAAHGTVTSARVIIDRMSGRSKGFGFVEFENEDDNQKAVDQLNGKDLDGRAIAVSIARPKEDRPQGGNGGGYRGGNDRGGNGGGSFRQRSW